MSIDERPVEVNGSRFGDWEMDIMVDNEQNAILSLIEKHTKYAIVRKLKSKKASHVADTVIAALIPFKKIFILLQLTMERNSLIIRRLLIN